MTDPTTLTFGETTVARIGLGTNRLTTTPENLELIRAAVAAGIGMIDTAHIYSSGDSERAIGAAGLGDDCLVATKGGYARGDARPEVLGAQIEESLRRLRTDSIGLYYLHKPDPDTPIEDSVGAITEYQERGNVQHVGVSNVSLEQLERARRVATIAAVQNHYNLDERESDDVVEHCAENDIAFVPYFPLRAAGGRALRELAERHGATPSQVTLAWLLHRSPTTLPIPGTLSLAHVKENLAALELELTDDEFESLS